jgi:predicted ATP-grasp superfamily ATP-dependent carboligase
VNSIELPDLVDPVMLIAFEGWNDAGEAATSAIDHLINVWQAEQVYEIDPEEFYDFQVNRPHFHSAEAGQREVIWPTTTFHVARIPLANRDVILVRGIEPNIRWKAFSNEVVHFAQSSNVSLVLGIGSLLADTAHTRPIPVTATSQSDSFPAAMNFVPSDYEGPTGVLGVIIDACSRDGIPSGSLWSQVPHYVATSPCPKATLALLSRIEEALDLAIDYEDLTEEAAEWEKDIDGITSDDDDLSAYVKQLEETINEDLESQSNIADEFERYLRRRDKT